MESHRVNSYCISPMDDDERKIKALEEELSILKKKKEVLENIKDKVPGYIRHTVARCMKEKERARKSMEEFAACSGTPQDVNEMDDDKRKIKALEEELSILKKEKEVLENIKDKVPDLALSTNLKELFQSGYEADVTVKVGEKEFLVHKAILATRSSVFRTMFETDMMEKKDGVVNIEDYEPGPVEDFLLFMYSGQFDIVKRSNALKLCLMADKYNVMQLKEACFEVMKKEMSIESICDAVYLASLYNKQDLLDRATDFFAQNMYKIVCTEKWLSFLTEHTVIGNELLMKSAGKMKQ